MTRDRILAVARDLLAEGGPEGISMRRIAQAVGVTPMAIYRHFADKDALIDELMLDSMALWNARVAAIETTDPIAWLEQLGEAFLDFALDEPRRFEAAFLLPAKHARRFPDDFAARQSPVIAMAHDRIDRAKAAGRLDDTPTLDIALAISAQGQGLVSMYRSGRFMSEPEFRQAYRRTVRRCLQGFQRETSG